jgi:hypothetical protein
VPGMFVLLAACGSEAPAGKDTPKLTQDTDKTSGNPKAGSGDTGGAGAATAPKDPAAGGTGVCAGKANSEACYSCCEASTPEIVAAAQAMKEITAKWQQCACAANKCATACATDYCRAGADPDSDVAEGSACEKCLDEQVPDCDAAEEAAEDALEKSPGFNAWEKCDEDAKCEAMEEAEDAKQ